MAAFRLTLLQSLLLLRLALCFDFSYPDFESGVGLSFNGAACTSSCDGAAGPALAYHAGHGANDASAAPSAMPVVMPSGAPAEQVSDTVSFPPSAPGSLQGLGVFPQRDAWALAPSGPGACAVRARLTPSAAGQAGSIMRLERSPVQRGFDSRFSFVVTDQSRTCNRVMDRSLIGSRSYASCAVTGGDGLAFVVHGDPAGSAALGGTGSGMGYAGLTNALVVEFDTWYNTRGAAAAPGEADPDLVHDHIAVQAALPGQPGGVGYGLQHRLGRAMRTVIADGRVHTARVLYEPRIRYDLLPFFSGSRVLLDNFIVDKGEGRRMGTLAVFFDNATDPIIAMPINLNAVLSLPDGRAFVGFTAATGVQWQKHDLLQWRFCEGSCEGGVTEPEDEPLETWPPS